MRERRNFRIFGSHPIYRHTDEPFKGTLKGVKAKVQKTLAALGPGWTVKAYTDGQVIYCAY